MPSRGTRRGRASCCLPRGAREGSPNGLRRVTRGSAALPVRPAAVHSCVRKSGTSRAVVNAHEFLWYRRWWCADCWTPATDRDGMMSTRDTTTLVLIRSGDATMAALLGGLVETFGFRVALASPTEEID